jgi:DNA polymerase-3 subunit beta
MKVTFNRAVFQDALALVGSIIPSRTPKPILQCIRLTAEKNRVRLCATDLEVGITYHLDQVEIAEEGDAVLPAAKLGSIVRESIDETIALEESGATAQLIGSDSRFTIYGHDPDQYPMVPGFEGKPDLEATLDQIQEGVEQSLFAAAKESTRYALNGVLWEISGKKLSLVATDGRRLAKCAVSLQKAATAPEGKTIIPAKTMGLLQKLSGDSSATVSVRVTNNQVSLACEPVTITSNLVEGNFPKYEDIIPKDYEKKVTLQTGAALSAVKRAALLANEDSKGIKLALEKGLMTFSSRAPETGDAQIQMPIEYEGEPIEIGFNPQFLLDVLRVIKAETFDLHLGQSDRPGMIKSGSNFLYIVMPVNL